MDQFLEVVKLGATSPNNDIRVENEKKLVDYRESDPLGFLNNCMASFGTDTTDAGIRQIIGTIFKVSISNENVE